MEKYKDQKHEIVYRRYYYSINTLRFYFISAIVLFHVHGFFGDPYVSALGVLYRQGGGLGNIFFLVSSGFLIASSYNYSTDKKKISFKNFSIKRLRSIYPLYFVSNVVQIVLYGISNGAESIDFSRVFLSLIFVSEGWVGTTEPYNFPTWFVCVLMICYAFYYAINHFSKNKTMYIIFLVAALLWGYACRGGQFNFPFCYSVTGSALFYFFSGCIVKEIVTLNPKTKVFTYSFLFAALLLICFFSYKYGFLRIASDPWALMAFVVMPCMLIICHEMDILNKICANKFWKHLGDLSMHIFFWHIPVFTVFKALAVRSQLLTISENGGAMMMVYFAALITVADLSRIAIRLSRKNNTVIKEIALSEK